jgi:hypothetical protein
MLLGLLCALQCASERYAQTVAVWRRVFETWQRYAMPSPSSDLEASCLTMPIPLLRGEAEETHEKPEYPDRNLSPGPPEFMAAAASAPPLCAEPIKSAGLRSNCVRKWTLCGLGRRFKPRKFGMRPTRPSSHCDSGDEVCGCDVNVMLPDVEASPVHAWRFTQSGSIGVELWMPHLECGLRLYVCYNIDCWTWRFTPYSLVDAYWRYGRN